MTDRWLHGESVYPDVLGAEERFDRLRVNRVTVNVPSGVILADNGRRQVAAAPRVLQPRVDRLGVRPRMMMPALMMYPGGPVRMSTCLDVQLRLELCPMILRIRIPTMILLRRLTAQAGQIGMGVRVLRL